jgi:hypothetical protein
MNIVNIRQHYHCRAILSKDYTIVDAFGEGKGGKEEEHFDFSDIQREYNDFLNIVNAAVPYGYDSFDLPTFQLFWEDLIGTVGFHVDDFLYILARKMGGDLTILVQDKEKGRLETIDKFIELNKELRYNIDSFVNYFDICEKTKTENTTLRMGWDEL